MLVYLVYVFEYIAVFDNPGVDGIEAVKNPFFGVKSAEELAVRLDLMDA